MTKLVLKKALVTESEIRRIGKDAAQQLEKFRKLILDHLDLLDDEREEKSMQKAFSSMIRMEKGGKGLAVGTVREWKGKKFKKIAPGKWRPVYESETRGAKMAIAAIKRKIAAAPDARIMMQIILENRDRFSDKNGQPLPFVQELSKYISSRGDALEGKNTPGKQEKKGKQKNDDIDMFIRGNQGPGNTIERNGDTVIVTKKDGEFVHSSIDRLKREYPKIKWSVKDGKIIGQNGNRKKQARTVVEPREDRTDQKKDSGKAGQGEYGEGQEKRDKKKAEKAEAKSQKFKASAEFSEAYKNGELSAGVAVYKMVMQGVTEKDAREAIGIPKDYDGSVDNWDRDQKRKAGNAINPGDMYVDRSPENRKKFAVRIVSKNGNDGYKASIGGTGIERAMSGIMEFDTKKEAKKYIDEHPPKAKKTPTLPKENKDWIDRNIGGDVDKKGNLHATDGSGQALKLTGLNLEYYNEAKERIKSGAGGQGERNENKKSDFEKIQEKYKNAAFEEGDDDQIQVGKELISGKWKLVEADTPTASHDETNFHKTPGFPTTDDGATINDRDYGHDREAQEIVMEIGSDYDGRAVSVDNPVVVTSDGIVISGNNRTMSSKIAARKGTDKGYIEALKRKAKKFGFTPDQVDKFKHPRVVFETAENKGYNTDQFAKFNKSSKKAMSPIESAVKVSKTIKRDTVESIAGKMSDFETLGELYADRNAVNDIFNTLQRDNIITSMDRPQYVVDGGITGAGKEFLETVLIGSVINESNIRGLNREGCKSIRQKLVRAITPLIENKGMDGYSVTKELNEAVDIAMQVAVHKDKFKSVDDYAHQKSLFGIEDAPVSVELARKLEGTQKEFAAFMQSMNGGLKYAANGETDIFLGNVESREDILARMLNLKKSIHNVIDFFRNLRAGKGPRFIKKAVPIQGENGETEFSERWMQESIEGIAPYVEEAGISDTGAKVVAVDFDGVINSYISGWKGPTETDAPVLSAAESLETLYNRGYKVIIFSTRANTQEGIDTVREYLRRHTKNNELADAIEVTDQKPIADMYIDDRAIPFNGDWEETLKRIEEFKPWTEKSLTWSGYPLQGRMKVHGMDISIENKKGSTRSGTDKDGHDWSIKMNFDYGYIRGTVGKDKDHLDCYIGPNPESEKVFIVHQNDPMTGEYDEDKVMLGFGTLEEAKKAYLSQYDCPGFLGDIDAMDIEVFKDKAFDPKNKGKKLRG
jgi:hypothetical protein